LLTGSLVFALALTITAHADTINYGALSASTSFGASPIGVSTANTLIGAWTTTGNNWDGWIDEVRISKIARSADWILAEYNNENSPSTFYSLVPP
jgi:hypothetical protein